MAPRSVGAAACVLLVALCAGCLGAVGAAVPATEALGLVSRDGSHFVLDGAPFYVTGANQYNLMTFASYGPTQKAEVIAVLDDAASLGINVIRTWAFCDGQRSGAAQPAAGEYDERVLRALDYVLAAARARGLRLLLTLTNYWDDFGGIQQYVEWAQASGDTSAGYKESFFSSATCKQMYLNYVEVLINRTNTVTGTPYKDDGSIFAWELINEARLPQDMSGDTLQRWIEDVSGAIKAMDPNHMVTTGSEGFFGPSTPEYERYNPYNEASAGTDFVRNHQADAIDFTTLHAYPDQWLRCSFECGLQWTKQWYKAHLDAAASIGRPLLAEEFGAKRYYGSLSQRDELFSAVFAITQAEMLDNSSAVGGDLFWLLSAAGVPDYDGYTVYLRDASTAQIIREHARHVAVQARNYDNTVLLALR